MEHPQLASALLLAKIWLFCSSWAVVTQGRSLQKQWSIRIQDPKWYSETSREGKAFSPAALLLVRRLLLFPSFATCLLSSPCLGTFHRSYRGRTCIQRKKYSVVNFLIFVHKNVNRIGFQEIKIRPREDFELGPFFSLFLMKKRRSSGQKWFLRPYFPLIRGIFVFWSSLRFLFRALEIPEPRVRKGAFSLTKMTFSSL